MAGETDEGEWGAPWLDPDGFAGTIAESRLIITESQRAEMVAHALGGLPFEACGLLVGTPDGTLVRFVPTDNDAASARVYTIPPWALLRADREADDDGLAVIGVMHSHTHTEAYPSPTDVAQAPDPDWHYVIVSLRNGGAATRSYRIVDGRILEEPVVVEGL